MHWFIPCVAGLLASLFRLVTCTECDRESMVACVQPFAKYEDEAKVLFKPYNETELNDVCRSFYEVNKCVKTVTAVCGDGATTVATIWVGVEDAFAYICGEGKQVFLKHRSCFADEKIQAKGEECNQYLINAQPTIQNSKGRQVKEKTKYEICEAVNFFVECLERAVEMSCGAEIGHWQQKVLAKTLSPTLNLANCRINSSNGSESHRVPVSLQLVLAVTWIHAVLHRAASETGTAIGTFML